ncbi:hypothetical protein M431DRAFT_87097 [Trichoderma harzianum CBS 226.95]|uniref:C2H2-type domain-containing protein n=1 Tax=Trichoderma harzianum CBS 226.95 TaxID=983964 RepID=A0A2T4AA59_TRIHA|nr:hypothetical protein M431DRAFT_87097 [Trichoderma harzianum CBS 226.95]PTB53965.1 hypothetical protein M431DRAFT_87097 [Trichoderma harzianum CBS 226.95]
MYHFWCPLCYWDDFDTQSELNEHFEATHYWCSLLHQHTLIHTAKYIECPTCPRKCSRESAMVLHLEVGRCPSGVGSEGIDKLAGECRQWRRFLDKANGFMYNCPTCGEKFLYMSGLLQHAESERCSEDLDETYGPLAIFLRFLRSRLG